MDEEIKPSQPTAESTPSEGDPPAMPPSEPELFSATVEPATAEDYARGFSFGTTFGTPYKAHPTVSSFTQELVDSAKTPDLPPTWILTKGWSIGSGEKRAPAPSEVVTALECMHLQRADRFIILEPPPAENFIPGYCQALADDDGYCCEIRIFGGHSENYVHYRLVCPDEHGRIWEPDSEGPGSMAGYYPDLGTVIRVFLAYLQDPRHLPKIDGYRWIDVTKVVDGLPEF